MADCNCPYCDAEIEISHDDGYGYDESETHNQQCHNCDKYFTYTTSISFYYDVEKADCLNGSNHDYQITQTIPREFSKMRCSMCGDDRELTEAERAEFKIGTKQEYFNSIKPINQ